ncbi:MAG: DMT family transporter [Pseudomonadota bacterium]
MENRFLQLLGCLAVFCSAFCFYLATAVVKWAKTAQVVIDPAYFVFARFLSGFILVCGVMLVIKRGPRPVRYDYLLGRTLTNCVAVFTFFKAVDATSVAEANILNMTYPLFIALISWVLFREERDPVSVGIVMAAFAGVWLIVSPGAVNLKPQSLWGVASGISAAVAIIYLNLGRKFHDTETTLFFLFGIGTLIMGVGFRHTIVMPDGPMLKYLALCSAFSVAGQYLITVGFKYVTALEGSIISSTRILLAAILGPLITADPILSGSGWIGAGLIFAGNIYLTVRKARASSRNPVLPG